jgi:hypothetical protein
MNHIPTNRDVDRKRAAWRVHLGAEVIISGFESTNTAARFAGNDALFQILISAPGWDE